MATSARIDMTDANGKSSNKAITYINPNADNAAITNFTQQLANMTTNTYKSTTRIDTTDITNATAKTTATITFTGGDSQAYSTDGYPFTYNGDATVYVYQSEYESSGGTVQFGGYIDDLNDGKALFIDSKGSGELENEMQITLRADESDNFTAVEKVFTVTLL